MLEILFICIFTSKMFKSQIYIHQKFSLIFIILFCSIMKILSIIFRMNFSQHERIYNKINWIIPIGILSYILITLLRAYSYCKTKWLFEFKFYSPLKLLILYGFFGAILCFILSIIPTFIPCNNFFENIGRICNLNDSLNNSTIYYYENYNIYFKNLWNHEEIYINIIYLLLFVIKLFLFFLIKLYLMFIIKTLGPEYIICSKSLFYFIIELINFIYIIIKIEQNDKGFRFYKFCETLGQFISFLGCIIYLELIGLNFCGLNKDLKKNIMDRSFSESSDYIVELVKEEENENEDKNE